MLSAFILELPLELRLSIFGLLAPSDVASAAGTCKALHAALQPILYSHITLEWRWQHEPALAPLLRTLLARPELTSYVQSLHFKGNSFDRTRLVVWRPDIPTVDVACLPREEAAAAVDGFELAGSAGEEWKDKLSKGNVDALVTLLVCLAPNLASLRLGELFAIENPVLGEVLRQSLCGNNNDAGGMQRTLPAFSKLRHVRFPERRQDESRRNQCKNAADVLPFLYLPALESLTLFIDNPAEFTWPSGAAAPAPSSLTALELFRIREPLLGYVLSTVPHLRYLKWQCFYVKGLDKPVSRNTIDLDAIGSALALVRKSVVDLVLEAESDIGRGEIDVPSMKTSGSISGLRELKRLKTLSIPWFFLMGFSPSEQRVLLDPLPESLERLTVTKCLYDHDEWNWNDSGRDRGIYEDEDNEDPEIVAATIIAALQGFDRTRLPNLCSIVVGWKPEEDERSAEKMEELEAIHRDYGVKVEWKW